MTPRKKGRLKLIPLFTYEDAPSMKQAYERVKEYSRMYANGSGRIHHVVVQVDERDGFGWCPFEDIVFPPREQVRP